MYIYVHVHPEMYLGIVHILHVHVMYMYLIMLAPVAVLENHGLKSTSPATEWRQVTRDSSTGFGFGPTRALTSRPTGPATRLWTVSAVPCFSSLRS